MAENSKIEWRALQRESQLPPRLSSAKATNFCRVVFVVAIPTKSDAVRYIKSKFRIIRERLDMVRVEIAATAIAAFFAGELIATEHIITPALCFWTGSQPATFNALPVNIPIRSFAARRSLAHGSAHFDARVDRVFFARSIAVSLLRGNAHLGARCIRHLLALHRRDESLASGNPRLLHFSLCLFGVFCHGR